MEGDGRDGVGRGLAVFWRKSNEEDRERVCDIFVGIEIANFSRQVHRPPKTDPSPVAISLAFPAIPINISLFCCLLHLCFIPLLVATQSWRF